MGLERPTAWIVLAVVALALFGYKRLPDASRSIGRSLRIFKSEIKGMADDDSPAAAQPPVADTAVPHTAPILSGDAPDAARNHAADVPPSAAEPLPDRP